MFEWRPHKLMMPGRILALLILAAAWLEPATVGDDNATVAVLIDHSDYLSSTAIVESRERLAGALNAYGDITINAMRFDATSVDESLEGVLDDALLTMRPNPANGAVIASHGYWPTSIEANLGRLAAAGFPVYWLPMEVALDKARILSIDAPGVARAGQEIVVSVTAVTPEDVEYELALYGNGSLLDRETARHESPTPLKATLPDSGTLLLSAELTRSDDGSPHARLEDGAIVNVIAPPTLLLVSSAFSPFGESLAAGGWPVTRVTPTGLAAFADQLHRFDALILDNVAASAVPSWDAVSDAVRRNAMGLIVLGGPDSFSLGGYRESALEDLLPLISEPPDSERPASVEFLVDISGSMASGESNTLRIAQTAVVQTVASLRPVDHVGLLAFDVDAREILPLASRDDHQNAIRGSWPERASGGTRLGPALHRGLQVLEHASGKQKILMVVTDGMLKDEDIEDLERPLANNDVELVVIIVSEEDATERLSGIGSHERATVLLVDDILRLPQLMRGELESRRPAVVQETAVPVVREAVPFIDTDHWPPLDAYLVTRPRPAATVHLQSPGGEALLASWNAGAGRVIALPAGLQQWAGEWLGWSQWPEFAAGLASYVAVRNTRLVQVTENDGRLAFDAVGEVPHDTLIIQPNGDEVSLAPELVAPRRFQFEHRLSRPGMYALIWESGMSMNRFNFVNPARSQPISVGDPVARKYVHEGLLLEWTAASAESFLPPVSRRSVLLILALAVFLFTIIVERVPLQKR